MSDITLEELRDEVGSIVEELGDNSLYGDAWEATLLVNDIADGEGLGTLCDAVWELNPSALDDLERMADRTADAVASLRRLITIARSRHSSSAT